MHTGLRMRENRGSTAKAYIARSSSWLELLENMSDPRSDIIGVGSHAAHYNDTRYLTFLSLQVFILLLTYCGCMVNGSAIQNLYEYSYVNQLYSTKFLPSNNKLSYICFNNHRGECPLQYPQQETGQIPDSMTVVFPWRDWECSLKDNRYLPAVFSVQETGHNKPDELVV